MYLIQLARISHGIELGMAQLRPQREADDLNGLGLRVECKQFKIATKLSPSLVSALRVRDSRFTIDLFSTFGVIAC